MSTQFHAIFLAFFASRSIAHDVDWSKLSQSGQNYRSHFKEATYGYTAKP